MILLAFYDYIGALILARLVWKYPEEQNMEYLLSSFAKFIMFFGYCDLALW